MEYRELVEVYQQLRTTTSTLEKTDVLAGLFSDADPEHLPLLVKLCRGELFAAWESDDILPSQTNRLAFVDDIVEQTGAIKVGVSGWAVDSSFKFRGGYDETFALSDHCGFTELLDLVAAADPEKVYTNHGFADELAVEITSRLGYETQALQRNQTTLGDF